MMTDCARVVPIAVTMMMRTRCVYYRYPLSSSLDSRFFFYTSLDYTQRNTYVHSYERMVRQRYCDNEKKRSLK